MIIMCVDCNIPESQCECGNLYRPLSMGETILATDEYLDDDGWRATTCAGGKAPDPQYTCHRQYRRRV